MTGHLLTRKKFFELFKYVPRLAADGVVIKKGRILLVRRNHAPYKNCWAIPGGFMEKGETVEAAAMREVLEETGVRTKAVKLVGVYSNPRRDPRGHVVSIPYILRPLSNRLRTSSETSDVRYFPISKIPRLPTDQNRIVEDALKILRK